MCLCMCTLRFSLLFPVNRACDEHPRSLSPCYSCCPILALPSALSLLPFPPPTAACSLLAREGTRSPVMTLRCSLSLQPIPLSLGGAGVVAGTRMPTQSLPLLHTASSADSLDPLSASRHPLSLLIAGSSSAARQSLTHAAARKKRSTHRQDTSPSRLPSFVNPFR